MSNLIKIYKSIRETIHDMNLVINANNMMMYYPDVKPQKNRVNLHLHDVKKTGWSYYDNGKYPVNLGDYLGKVIVDWMLEKRGMSLNDEVIGVKHLITVGSGGLKMFQDATIWGTGIYGGHTNKWSERFHNAKHRKLDIRAVRGPLTRQVYIDLGHKCPEVYGDPAILMPLIYKPLDFEKKYDYLIIPQYTQETWLRRYIKGEYIISMNTDDYKAVIDKIVSCKYVISSSLHGIILAESYGVPAVYFNGRPGRQQFKFKDYYLGTGRTEFPLVTSLVEAYDSFPPQLPDLDKLRQGLLDSFPYDLWAK